MVKIHFLPKVIKNGLVSEKNYFIFFHNREGKGGSGPFMEFSIFFFFNFFNPSIMYTFFGFPSISGIGKVFLKSKIDKYQTS